MCRGKTHVFIPDMQVKPGVNLDYCRWVGEYIASRKPDVIINAGDFADMPSLSSYDKGKRDFEGRRYKCDIAAVQKGMELLMKPLRAASDLRSDWEPRLVMLMGNHEQRIETATQYSPELEGLLSFTDLQYEQWGWEVVPFRVPKNIDGIMYCHYFENPDSLKGNVLSGTIENRLNKLGASFTQGHQQKLQYGMRYSVGRTLQGLVAGSCYPHKEKYLGPQANEHWRGLIVKHEVHHGTYDPMFVSLDFLRRRFK